MIRLYSRVCLFFLTVMTTISSYMVPVFSSIFSIASARVPDPELGSTPPLLPFFDISPRGPTTPSRLFMLLPPSRLGGPRREEPAEPP